MFFFLLMMVTIICISFHYKIDFCYFRNSTTLFNGRIILNENSKADNMTLEKYAFF